MWAFTFHFSVINFRGKFRSWSAKKPRTVQKSLNSLFKRQTSSLLLWPSTALQIASQFGVIFLPRPSRSLSYGHKFSPECNHSRKTSDTVQPRRYFAWVVVCFAGTIFYGETGRDWGCLKSCILHSVGWIIMGRQDKKALLDNAFHDGKPFWDFSSGRPVSTIWTSKRKSTENIRNNSSQICARDGSCFGYS